MSKFLTKNCGVLIENVLLNILFAQLEEIVQEYPSPSIIEIVEKCCGLQTRSHVFWFGGWVKSKDLKGGTSSNAEILSTLCSTRDDKKFLIEENKSLNDVLYTLEDAMK